MDLNQCHIQIEVHPHFQPTGLAEIIVQQAGKNGLVVEIDEKLNQRRDDFRGLDAPHTFQSLITAEINDSFFDPEKPILTRETIFPDLVINWIDNFDSVFQKNGGSIEEFFEKGLRLYPLTIYFFGSPLKLCFTFPLKGGTKLISSAWLEMVEILDKLRKKDEQTVTWLESLPLQKNNMCFLIYEPGTKNWQLINRLLDVSKRLSDFYHESINDDRIFKPYIVFNEDNYNQYDYFGKEWSLQIDQGTIIMPRPNDIALYVHLADKSLTAAESFYKEEHKRRASKLHMSLLHKEDYLKYYDYFENIIAAITFSYTSIETLANTCIPQGHEHIEEGKGKDAGIKTIYSKEAIEKNFHLRDKLKIVLKNVLKTTDVTMEKWWDDFISLEQIRNEIIHTKQSKSEERYSFFLTKQIFRVISCNKAIIKYYGEYIQKELPNLLFDFPYSFGYDTVPASFMSNKEYVEHYNELHNPYKPWEGDPPVDE